VQNPQTPSHPNSSKCWLLHPTKWHRSSPYQGHGEEVEEKTRDVGKQEEQGQEPSQEDGRDRPQDLEYIHPTPQTKPKLFC
jgi:hypothetical protein